MSDTFDPRDFHTFEYKSFEFGEDHRELRLNYALVGERTLNFTEEIDLPDETDSEDPTVLEAANHLARLLFWVAGLSYYNLAAPHDVVVKPPISQIELEFLHDLFAKAITEFAYSNNLPEAMHPHITADQDMSIDPVDLKNNLPRSIEPVVLIGGGKDSIVTIEALRAGGYDKQLLFSVNTFKPMKQTAEVAALPYIYAIRHLSPAPTKLDETHLYKRRHVPVTMLNSIIGLIVAVLSGRGTIILSNERSASVGNVQWEGIEVNHQWSKSLEAEKMLDNMVTETVSPDLRCFSLLRPLSELRIARQFAKLKQYHQVFTSCNRSFKLDPSARFHDWCDDCDKCRFVYLSLAPYLNKEELLGIFGKDLLADSNQAKGYHELLGIVGHKPLECVGEIEEARLALLLAEETGNWHGVPAFEQLVKELPDEAYPTKEQRAETFETSSSHLIPEEYMEAFNEIK